MVTHSKKAPSVSSISLPQRWFLKARLATAFRTDNGSVIDAISDALSIHELIMKKIKSSSGDMSIGFPVLCFFPCLIPLLAPYTTHWSMVNHSVSLFERSFKSFIFSACWREILPQRRFHLSTCDIASSIEERWRFLMVKCSIFTVRLWHDSSVLFRKDGKIIKSRGMLEILSNQDEHILKYDILHSLLLWISLLSQWR